MTIEQKGNYEGESPLLRCERESKRGLLKRVSSWIPRGLLAPAFIVVFQGQFSDGVEAYRAGRYEDAFKAFTALEPSDGASVQLLFNRALAGIQIKQPMSSEVAAEMFAAKGGKAEYPLRDFLLGNAAFVRSELIVIEAGETDAGPTVFDLALIYAEKARDAWRDAAMSQEDWPEARRNVERALLKIEDLKVLRAKSIQKKKEKEQNKKEAKTPEEETPEEDPDKTGEEENSPKELEAIQALLSPAQILALLDKLKEREKQKSQARREARGRKNAGVEKDW